jgi:hypothetical protein
VSLPEGVETYDSLGIPLAPGRENWTGDCPLCDAEGKFSVKATTSQFRCWSCEKSGNASVFAEEFWAVLDAQTKDYGPLAAERGLEETTLMQWGFCWNPYNARWYCPGYNESKTIRSLYRYDKKPGSDKWGLMATKGLTQQMYGVHLYDRRKENVTLTEGVWDAMKIWEVFSRHKMDDGRPVRTASNRNNLLSETNVIGLPGCTTFFPKWAKLIAGKHVMILFDNDHERVHKNTGKTIQSSALLGIKRLIEVVSGGKNQPASISYLMWGETQDYYSADQQHGFDVSDAFEEGV